jgi:kelch-like protein 17 (actinfilin)/kelch-like protein 20
MRLRSVSSGINFYFYGGIKYRGPSNHINTARNGPGAAELGGKVYIVGGRSATAELQTLEVLDLGWEGKAAPPAPVSGYGAVSSNGKLYAMGGQRLAGGAMQDSNAVYEYDPAGNAWREMPSAMPFYARGFSLVAAYGKIYLFGGQTSATAYGPYAISNMIYEYDPQIDVWAQKNTMATARQDLSAALNGEVYVAGGVI